ncbi:acetyl-CoA/propionyl-CoA carboxylase carboxyl transferase subunit [Pseudonocardia sediminis]|uniref:Acetyl-CoA/propionyl-CoA carboxylase carboxyl transferase subunit n=1 Tax=Pseudonocardia sediminis TaxID=1397368 RepID=A0A4Q7V768_PSEST|nr:carboxyl transferase domain-containing protein [Pseudonocardia sediminis]RZT88643.1 acetyl-CoA/propionyl-CoA carboxylase carboxyl transferase subunit [Pseudonocardia sediminis]
MVIHQDVVRSGPAAAPPSTGPEPVDGRDPVLRLGLLGDPGSVTAHPDGPDGTEPHGAAWARMTVDGAPCVAFALDPRVSAGALSTRTCATILDAYRAAREARVPVVGLWHSSGARLQEGAAGLDAVAQVFRAMTAASGRIPQISVIVGPAAGGAAYGPALTDVVVTAPEARMFITGPDVVHTVTGERVGADELGGPDVHGTHSGVAHVRGRDLADALGAARRLVTLLHPDRPESVGEVADRDLAALLPAARKRAYDVHPVIDGVLDGPGLELHPDFSPNIVTVLGALGGRTIGVVASNPLRKGGCLDAQGAEKAARFVRMCDGFGVPLLVLVDVPGYLPGVQEEWGGVVRRGAKLLHAFAEATVPSVSVILRKAFGGAYIAMNCRGLGAGTVFAWPGAEIAVMGAPAAVRILHRRELRDHPDPGAREEELVREHAARAGTPDEAVGLGLVDRVIDPDRTRSLVAAALRVPARRGDHANIPL